MLWDFTLVHTRVYHQQNMQKASKQFSDFQISELSIKDYRHMQMAQIFFSKIVITLLIKPTQIKTIEVPIFTLQISKYTFQRKCQQCEK